MVIEGGEEISTDDMLEFMKRLRKIKYRLAFKICSKFFLQRCRVHKVDPSFGSISSLLAAIYLLPNRQGERRGVAFDFS